MHFEKELVDNVASQPSGAWDDTALLTFGIRAAFHVAATSPHI
jgi:hypothetical protein